MQEKKKPISAGIWFHKYFGGKTLELGKSIKESQDFAS